MTKIRNLLLFFVATFQIARATPQEAFSGYKTAILEQEGQKASSLVTSTTIKEFQKYVDAAKYAEKEDMKKLPFLTRFQALIFRHRLPKKALKKMDGMDVFVYAVNNDWIGKTGVASMTIDNVKTSGTKAVSDAFLDGQKAPYKFTYKEENGEWKFDLTQILSNSEAPLKMAAKQAQMKEDDFIFSILETISGNRPTEKLWTPPFKK